MSTILKISRFYTGNTFKIFLIVIASTLLVHIGASVLVDALLGPEREAGIVSPLVLAGGFCLGTFIFPASFRYLSSQGISRKDYWISTGLSLTIVSAATALLLIVYQAVIIRVSHIMGTITIYEGMYHNLNFLSMFVWEFAAMLMLSIAGWLDRVVAYRAGPKVMIAMYAFPVIGWILLAIFNSKSNGALLDSIVRFLARILGFYNGVFNPYMAVLSFTLLAVVLFGIIYLLLRRAPVTD